jgi:hypothetical protein
MPYSSWKYRVLFSEARSPGSLQFEIAAADFTPDREVDDWEPLTDEAHRLTPDDIEISRGLSYRSIRDPAAVCHPGHAVCRVYMVLFVGEPDTTAGGEWTGDDLLYAEYDIDEGFVDGSVFVVLDGDVPASNPLSNRYLAEPWIILNEDSGQYFVWVTTNEPNLPTEVDLLLVVPAEGSGEGHHPFVPGEPSGAVWSLYPGSPVLTARDLELLWPIGNSNAADCSGSCEIGGITGVVVPSEISGRDTLHLWVSVAERPALDAPPVFHLRHLVQPFGLP